MTKIFIRVFALLLIIVAISCEKNRIDSPRQLQEKEFKLLNEFLEVVPHDSINPEGLTVRDMWTKNAVDTIDQVGEEGILYFENVTGSGKVLEVGKEVGYRYIRSVIYTDSIGEPNWGAISSNYYEVNPQTHVIGDASDNSVPAGVRQALIYMRKYGKSRVIVPSTQGGGNYETSIYDLEVTYAAN
ncbi:hypothetical protein [Labilibacter marinus]|uniref:hypothetical protein n=1 Tax=Labilibacter marinus TaxID=1477105 RepID=UPI00082AEB3F|nr:hypothetical protein [Labilibacter marinus]